MFPLYRGLAQNARHAVKKGEQRTMRRLAIACLVIGLAAVCNGAAEAQVADYGTLMDRLQGGEPAGESQSASPPQSLPRVEFDPDGVPSAEAYGRITNVGGDPMLGAAQRMIEVFRARLVDTLLHAPGAFGEFVTGLEAASPTGHAGYFVGTAIFALLLLALGRGVNALYRVYLARPLFVGVQRPDPRGYLEKLPVLVYRVVLTLFGVALTLATAAAIGLFYYDGHEATLNTVIVIFAAYGGLAFVNTVWRMALCPYLPAYRLPTIEDDAARRMYLWMSTVSSFAILAMAFCYWVAALGLPHEVHVLLTAGLTLVTVIGLILALQKNRFAIRAAILSGVPRAEASWLTILALRLWMPGAAVYLFGSWAKLSFDLVMGIQRGPLGLIVPYLVLLGGLLAYALTSYAIERIFTRSRQVAELNAEMAARRAEKAAAEQEAQLSRAAAFSASGDIDGDGDEEGGPPPSADERPEPRQWAPARRRGMQTFEDLARRVASLVALAAAAYGLVYYWGGPGLFAETMVFGIAEAVIDILLVGYVAFHAVRIWIDQKIAEEVGDEQPPEPGEGEGGGAGASRLATLLPLVRNFILTVIAIAIGLVIASELGFNVAPLFAGAGIVGLAIGFGSQTLVRDILSGAFFLMDDAFRKGEYIDVGSVKGVVEKISLRSFQLRHHLGMLHTIPFGELQYLTNYSRDWVMMKLPLRVTYDTDVEHVRKLIKTLGQELLEDPTIGDKFLMPLKSQGVIQMEESAMIVRVKFMCKPGEQWVIRKRVFQEIRELFEREGIKFAHREVTVRMPDMPSDRPPTEAERQAAGAASRTALDVIEGEALEPTGTAGTAARADER